MNKDVIYIEPEDDITDIISRLKSSEQKVVALVPPKKIGVLRSAVNNKLIAKSAKEAEKVVVMVTSDASLVKIASGAGLPVAKTLQSRPVMPGDLPNKSTTKEELVEEEIIEEDASDDTSEVQPSKTDDIETIDEEDSDEDDPEKDDKKSKDDKKNKKDIPKFEKYRKWIIIGSVAGVALICFLVWAFIFAPAANITVAIKTTANNFNENVSFVQNASSADVKSGKFAYDKETEKNEVSVDFDATGEKDVGEKASGTLSISYYFGTNEKNTTISISSGTIFSYNGLNYVATNSASMVRTSGSKECDNADNPDSLVEGCRMSTSVNIQASESGANYNLDASRTDWSNNVNPQFHIVNPSAISGGTSKVIKVVQASDVASAREKLTQKIDNSDLKDKLLKKLSDDYYAIDSSYSTESPDPVVSPTVGEEASSGKGTLTASTTATVYGVKKSDISDYVNEIASKDLPDDQKVYDIGEPFFEKFDASSLTAKLKTTTHTGPKVTVAEIMEKAKGRKIGEVQSLLRSINGIANVTINKSVPWMSTIPDDDNKVTVEMTVEDQ